MVEEPPNTRARLAARAGQISETKRQALNVVANRIFQLLLPFQWLGSAALCLLPPTFTSGGGLCNRGLCPWSAIALSTLLNSASLLWIQRAPTHRYLVSASQVTFYVLLLCIGGGRFDTHFYLFVSVGFLCLYRDWKLLTLAGAAELAAYYAYSELLCATAYPSDAREFYHHDAFASWALVETLILSVVCKRASLLYDTAGREQAQLEFEREAHQLEIQERTRQLQATNEQYRALLESTSAVPWELDDSSGVCRYIGSQVEQQWGWPPDRFQQESFLFSRVHPDDRPAFAQALEDAVASQDVAIECRLQLKSERFAYIRSFIRQAPDEKGRIVRGISIDITTQKKLESELNQAQKLESVGRLAAGVAHEINTPVQFVNDNCYFLRDAVAEVKGLLSTYQETLAAAAAGTLTLEQAREQLHSAEEAADLEFLTENMLSAVERSLEGLERVATIVRSMKEYSHPDCKERSAADLNAAIRNTLTIARNEYKYVADIDTQLGDLPLVQCYVGDFNQAFLNILVNAAHAIGEANAATERRGLITITTQQEGADVLVSVKDTGRGIPEAIQGKIFDPFFTTKEVGKGTGQGLAIARAVIVDKHEGTLTFETEPGIGTTFRIRIPIDPDHDARDGLAAA